FQSHYVRITTTFFQGMPSFARLFQSHYVRITTIFSLFWNLLSLFCFNRTMLGLQSVDCLPQALPREFQILAIGCGKVVFACRRLYPAQITFLTIS
ncbi:MAG: hypothetical protein ACPLRO_06925, partial [Candidatus Kapaibacteriota bacterium]